MKFLLDLHDDVINRDYRDKIFATPLQIHNVIGFSRGSVRTAIQRLHRAQYVRRGTASGMYQTNTRLFDKFIVDSYVFIRNKPSPVNNKSDYLEELQNKLTN